MVIGNGLIAKRFDAYRSNKAITIFASGVSNSKNSDPAGYEREKKLLRETIDQNKNTTLIYFSTCSIYDPVEKSSAYVAHKLELEEMIRQQMDHYYIFRISNLAGKTDNQNTILNFFVSHIRNGIHFNLWSGAERNLVDIDDMYLLTDHIITNKLYRNEIINIANPVNYKVTDIVTAIETLLMARANYSVLPKGQPFAIDVTKIQPIIPHLGAGFGADYLFNLLRKYYI